MPGLGFNGATEVPDHPQENLGIVRQRCPTSCPTTNRHCTALDFLYSLTKLTILFVALDFLLLHHHFVLYPVTHDITWTPQPSRACGHYKTPFPQSPTTPRCYLHLFVLSPAMSELSPPRKSVELEDPGAHELGLTCQ